MKNWLKASSLVAAFILSSCALFAGWIYLALINPHLILGLSLVIAVCIVSFPMVKSLKEGYDEKDRG